MRLGILTSHPIQYQSPWFRGLAKVVDLEVFFCHRQSAAEQGKAGFGVAFDWDVDLLSGYQHRFLKNISARPGVSHFDGCDTPEIAQIIGEQIQEETSSPSPISYLPSSTRLRFDAFIVSGWNLKSYWQAARACRRAGVPVLVRGDSQLRTPRSLFKRWGKELIYRILLRRFDGFLTVGKKNREYLEHYGVPPDKIFFAPHFVDNEWLAARAAQARNPLRLDRGEGQGEVSSPSSISDLPSAVSSARSILRREWGAGDQDLVVLFVGKFQAIKRPADLLLAMARVRDHATTGLRDNGLQGQRSAVRGQWSVVNGPKLMAVFVGSGEMDTELRELSARENLRVHFAGFKNQSELPRYYAGADVLVLPSASETWGLVVNEAMACGLPAIVSDAVGCAPDLIEDGKTGFTFPVADVTALVDRLERLAKMKAQGHDSAPALAEKMRAYSVETAVKGTLEAVEKLKGPTIVPIGQ